MSDPAFWAKAHGASTHFPVALVFCSAALDSAGLIFSRKRVGQDLLAAGYWAMVLGALGTIPAVISGIIMTRGTVWGHGALRAHHLFIWPGFALSLGLGAWRLLNRNPAPRPAFAAYLVLAGSAAGLILAGAYWGGEMMIRP